MYIIYTCAGNSVILILETGFPLICSHIKVSLKRIAWGEQHDLASILRFSENGG